MDPIFLFGKLDARVLSLEEWRKHETEARENLIKALRNNARYVIGLLSGILVAVGGNAVTFWLGSLMHRVFK